MSLFAPWLMVLRLMFPEVHRLEVGPQDGRHSGQGGRAQVTVAAASKDLGDQVLGDAGQRLRPGKRVLSRQRSEPACRSSDGAAWSSLLLALS